MLKLNLICHKGTKTQRQYFISFFFVPWCLGGEMKKFCFKKVKNNN